MRDATPSGKIDPPVADRSQLSRLRFYVIGDFGSSDHAQAKVADAMALFAEREPPDFILGTGDSLYPLDDAGKVSAASLATVLAERFDPYYARLGVEFFQCIGNEDLENVFGGDATHMFAHTYRSPIWRMPAASYRIPKLPPWIAIHVAVLVGHHPVFTPGKRTYRFNGDGELLYMRILRRAIEDRGVHFYFTGHEHHQSCTDGPRCVYVVQGCGGVGERPNAKHSRRDAGWRDAEKAFRFLEVMGGFAVVEADAVHSIRLRFFGIPFGESAEAVRVIYERRWKGLDEIGDRSLKPLTCD